MTLDARIATRRAALMRQRADRQDELDLPRTMTQRQVNEYRAETVMLERQIAAFEATVATYVALPSADADARWHDFLVTARGTLAARLLAIKSPIRDKDLLEGARDLEWSIRLIDHGFGISTIGPLVTLEPTCIGELMATAGYVTSGPDLHGPNGWRGSLPDVERRIADLARQRTAALSALDGALMADDERATREAEDAELIGALNGMRVKVSGDPEVPGLVAFTLGGEVLDVSAMTPLQRRAFERANAAHAPRTEPVTS